MEMLLESWLAGKVMSWLGLEAAIGILLCCRVIGKPLWE